MEVPKVTLSLDLDEDSVCDDDVFEECEFIELPVRFQKDHKDYCQSYHNQQNDEGVVVDISNQSQDIDVALRWLRQELTKIRQQDQDIANQFLKIQLTIQHIKDRKSELERIPSAKDSTSSLDEYLLQSSYTRLSPTSEDFFRLRSNTISRLQGRWRTKSRTSALVENS
ncbi:uncharacterized protein LOC106171807 [Lingula anatina]|uniref:Uncharacterized protein LOC106171807 n=1 Tax=Lingula anatina TaxID=7574 RepID=A0A1S3JC23_LINAN|nr:uncharacterized protein LOC106171807 [Lingula anatina]|eukprot:XP_013407736.1 uncharacterized protein LOC106171807 [Lingula anatina]